MSVPKILMLVSEDWYFVSHRLAFAKNLIAHGFEVAVGCRTSGQEKQIENAGIKVFSVPLSRESLSFRRALHDSKAIRKVVKTFKPDILHLVALRPILVGSIAGIGLRIPRVNAITGMGSLFTGDLKTLKLKVVKLAVSLLLKPIFNSPFAYNVFQNEDDFNIFISREFSRLENSFIIQGSGVDPNSWLPYPEPTGTQPVIIFVGRLLRDKGVTEVLEASRLLKARGIDHLLRLVGNPDPCNPSSYTEEEALKWQQEGKLEYLGRRSDVLLQMSNANLILMPSYYREGFPKVLLEAGLAERAVVTCDVIGCREIVKDGVNGILIPPANAVALADATEKLLKDQTLRRTFASRNREIVCARFSMAVIEKQFLAIYQKILSRK